jgi:hypothetical protein
MASRLDLPARSSTFRYLMTRIRAFLSHMQLVPAAMAMFILPVPPISTALRPSPVADAVSQLACSPPHLGEIVND